MTASDPHPGDRVLIKGTIPRHPAPPEPDVVWVDVDCQQNTLSGIAPCEKRLLVHRDRVAEVVGPEWLPAQDGDVMLDRDGHAWQYVEYDDGRGLWHCVLGADFGTDDLLDQFGPVTLVSRAGKPVES